MKTLMLILALSLCAAAQTFSNVSGLTLKGPAADPTIENRSGKPLLWMNLKQARPVGGPAEGGTWFIDQAGGLPDGASALAITNRLGRGKPTTTATITAAIFADGEFRGEDKSPIRYDVEITFQLMREAWRLAQAGEWGKLQDMADKVDDGILPQITAQKFLQARGNITAMAALAYYGLLPANVWRAEPLVNKIPFLQLLAQWFAPLVAHAQTDLCTLPSTCPAWSSGTVIQYPQSGTWVYNCDDYSGSPDPCPGIPPPPANPNSTPWIGIAAHCTAADPKWGSRFSSQ